MAGITEHSTQSQGLARTREGFIESEFRCVEFRKELSCENCATEPRDIVVEIATEEFNFFVDCFPMEAIGEAFLELHGF